MRYTGPKDRLSRREGSNLFNSQKLNRLTTPPGQHGPKGGGRVSQYGRQLREKQKVKRMYGLQEGQFRKLFDHASKSKGNTGEALLVLLETRLDNVVYRLGFAASRPEARQIVSHRHVMVNDKKLNIPSYHVRVGETIRITDKIAKSPSVKKVLDNKDYKLPDWVQRKATVGKIVRNPVRDDILEPLSEADIVEFYSR